MMGVINQPNVRGCLLDRGSLVDRFWPVRNRRELVNQPLELVPLLRPLVVQPEITGILAGVLDLPPRLRIREAEALLSPEHVSKPGLLVHHLTPSAQPGLAGELHSHLPQGAVLLVHPVDFPVALPPHEPAGPDAAHHVCDFPLGLGTLLESSPVLKVKGMS